MAAHEFARQCTKNGTANAINELAGNMARDGYGATSEHREWGKGVIERSLTLTLGSDPVAAGARMLMNYNTLNHRPSLIEQLSIETICPVLVVHGRDDKAVCCLCHPFDTSTNDDRVQYPFERLYHERTVAAIGNSAELFVLDGPHFVTVSPLSSYSLLL